MRLFHYTCDHGAERIDGDGFLLPSPHPLLPDAVTWATDLDEPLRPALGLTSDSGLITCDRGTVRYEVQPVEVEAGAFVPWVRYARPLSWQVRHALEAARGAMPMHWYVARRPVAVVPRGRS
jgi:hypothetical protein